MLSIFTLIFYEFLYHRYLHYRTKNISVLFDGTYKIHPDEIPFIKELHDRLIYEQKHPFPIERIFVLSLVIVIQFFINLIITSAFGAWIVPIPFCAINYIIYSKYHSAVTDIPIRLRRRLWIMTFLHPLEFNSGTNNHFKIAIFNFHSFIAFWRLLLRKTGL